VAQTVKGASEFYVTSDLQFNRTLQNRALEQAGRFIAEDLLPAFCSIWNRGSWQSRPRVQHRQRGHQHQINRISTMAATISHAQLNGATCARNGRALYVVVGEEDLLRDMHWAR